MKQVLNNWFPFGGFKAFAFWPWMFIKSNKAFTETDLRHEEIHFEQQLEMLPFAVLLTIGLAFIIRWWSLFAILLYYWIYAVCWLKELVHCLFDKQRGQIVTAGYRKRNYIHRVEHAIIFEREAYSMQNDAYYLKRRKWFGWRHF